MSASSVTRERTLHDFMPVHQFLKDLPFGMILCDSQGQVVDVNDRSAALFGVSRSDFLTVGFSDEMGEFYFDNESALPHKKLSEFISSVVSRETTNLQVEISLPEKSHRWLRASSRPYERDGRLVGISVMLEDRSEIAKDEAYIDLLSRASRMAIETSDEKKMLQSLCDGLVAQQRNVLATVGVASTWGGRQLVSIIASAGETQYVEGLEISVDDGTPMSLGPTGMTLHSGKSHYVNDSRNDPRTAPWRERMEKFGIRSLISIPLTNGRDRLAVTIYSEYPHFFYPDSIEILTRVVEEVEFGLRHVQSLRQLEKSFTSMVDTLGEVTEVIDPYTAGHQRRVADLGAAICAQLGCHDDFTELVRLGGKFHDIGKIRVPRELLTSPRRLNSVEFELIKQHATVGYEILRKASMIWPIPEVAYQHHERLDGSGYPRGLSGDDICLPARIIAVSDVLEAMTQHRPYRPGLGIEAAMAEVVSGAHVRYDADVVAAAVTVFEAGYTFESAFEVSHEILIDSDIQYLDDASTRHLARTAQGVM